ncbi:RluA family pseudouridine synthase [Oceanibacterium hippocampi]|uniref:Pseudouridine synthase n=1 Tax=Oceanibacterium hippocampi TaxID=745714 RepID=A0A1Y5SIN3_9PROT|nr:RluA family pseudouridine synthase [Oceanibacterium hippocampi]SLN40514.1 Ribosomal large subunit pseudouridine synthase C [Oceanibacterium hippocampi]
MRVQTLLVQPDEAELRLDRWFSVRFPGLTHSRLAKLIRKGEVRIDGRRAKPGDRLAAGQTVRVPPLPDEVLEKTVRSEAGARAPMRTSPEDAAMLRDAILHFDDRVIVLNKPPGLPVQGGSGLDRHLDGMLDALMFEAHERPRLVHRLDKDTSGVLLLARDRKAAQVLAAAFKSKDAIKTYWALVVGVPKPRQGRIDLPLSKHLAGRSEKVEVDREEGQRAITDFAVVDAASNKAAWLAMRPLTGRTHQLRVHSAAIGTPIVGDGKYGGPEAYLSGGVSKKLHLHARAISIPHPDGGLLEVEAPLPTHLVQSFAFFGWSEQEYDDPFAEEEEF